MLDISQLMLYIRHLLDGRSYDQTLESYILSRNPQNTSDVERFTQEFSRHYEPRGGALW